MRNWIKKKANPPSGQIAVYSVCDNLDYVYKALITLASVKRFHSNVDFFIVGPLDKTDQKKARKLCKRLGGNYLYLDLGDVFLEMLWRPGQNGPGQGIRLPRNTFWHLYGHQFFSELGYEYSCHLDGDTFCVNPIPFEQAFSGDKLLAGVYKNDGELNSGVMFYDHAKANSFQFFDKISKYYNDIPIVNPDGPYNYFKKISSFGKENSPNDPDEPQGDWRCYCGDQELLTMATEDINLTWNRLPSSFNYLTPRNYENAYLKRNVTIFDDLEEIYILHILHKPWCHQSEMEIYPMLEQALKRWWEFAEEIWESEEIRNHIGSNPFKTSAT